MLTPSLRNVIAASAIALFAATPAVAQEPPNGAKPDDAQPNNPQQIQQELLQIQQQLQQIQGRALKEDPALQKRQEALNDLLVETMTKIDPSVQGKLDRLEGLRTELQTAQQAQDTAKMQELVTEGQQIQQQLSQTEAKALEDETVASQIEEFETQVVNKMEEIDPKTPTLIARAEELARRLRPQPDA